MYSHQPDCGANAPCCGVHHERHCACNACFRKTGHLVFHPTCQGFKHAPLGAKLKPVAAPPSITIAKAS